MHFSFPLNHSSLPTHLILCDLITILGDSRKDVTEKVVLVEGQTNGNNFVIKQPILVDYDDIVLIYTVYKITQLTFRGKFS